MENLRFFWNGIKASDGKLQKVSYSTGELMHYPDGTITIYKRDYLRFSDEVHQYFKVENDTDAMVDYFDKDTIRVVPSHPFYALVAKAVQANKDHYVRMAA